MCAVPSVCHAASFVACFCSRDFSHMPFPLSSPCLPWLRFRWLVFAQPHRYCCSPLAVSWIQSPPPTSPQVLSLLPWPLLLHIRMGLVPCLKLIIYGALWNARSFGMTLHCCGREVDQVSRFPFAGGKYSCLKAAIVYLKNAHPSLPPSTSFYLVGGWFLFKALLLKPIWYFCGGLLLVGFSPHSCRSLPFKYLFKDRARKKTAVGYCLGLVSWLCLWVVQGLVISSGFVALHKVAWRANCPVWLWVGSMESVVLSLSPERADGKKNVYLRCKIMRLLFPVLWVVRSYASCLFLVSSLDTTLTSS